MKEFRIELLPEDLLILLTGVMRIVRYPGYEEAF